MIVNKLELFRTIFFFTISKLLLQKIKIVLAIAHFSLLCSANENSRHIYSPKEVKDVLDYSGLLAKSKEKGKLETITAFVFSHCD